MSEFHEAVFNEFKAELEKWMTEIFLAPLPFTQVNRLAMLAATVAEQVATQRKAHQAPPALLAACEAALYYIGGIPIDRIDYRDADEILDQLEAAIADAKGEA